MSSPYNSFKSKDMDEWLKNAKHQHYCSVCEKLYLCKIIECQYKMVLDIPKDKTVKEHKHDVSKDVILSLQTDLTKSFNS